MQVTDLEKDFLKVGYTVATESNYLVIFDTMLDACMRYTRADAATLYMVDDEEGRLVHLVDMSRDQEREERHSSSQADMELVSDRETNLYTYCYHQKQLLNIADVYKEKRRFDITDIVRSDEERGYRTQSMLVCPIYVPGKKVLGVLSLCNCLDADEKVIPFDTDCESIVRSLSSQMANSLTNIILIQDMDEMLGSFVQSLTTAIDEKTPYNANHTRHVEQYCMRVVDYLNAMFIKEVSDIHITDRDKEQLSMAALLHDIGKIITRREVLNKASRLGENGDRLWYKLERIRLMRRIDFLEGRMDEETWLEEDTLLYDFINDLERLNSTATLTAEDMDRIEQMSGRTYRTSEGEIIPYLDMDEQRALHIRKGTLTYDERKEVQKHVVYTDMLLAKIKFTEKYDKVRMIAATHHELLDGSGYPKGLRGEQLGILTRILTVCDIYDSLTADDRPYKARTDHEQAVEILKGMADEGKLDPRVVSAIAEAMRE